MAVLHLPKRRRWPFERAHRRGHRAHLSMVGDALWRSSHRASHHRSGPIQDETKARSGEMLPKGGMDRDRSPKGARHLRGSSIGSRHARIGHTMSLTIGSLFSGIGGIELGLEWAGLGPVMWQVEKDPFCRDVLKRHWPEVKRYEDVRQVGRSNLAPVDLICGGFPCQDTSSAGSRKGLEGPSSGLWREFHRIRCRAPSPLSPLWKTLRAGPRDGCAKCGANSRHLDIERAPWGLPLATSEHLTADPAYLLLPTPTASRYGTTNNGDPHDGRSGYRTKGKPSLAQMARRGMWPTPLASEGLGGGVRTWRRPKKTGKRLRDMVAGRLNPKWVEWFMGFPPSWLNISTQASFAFSETRPSRSARKCRAK